MHSPAKLGLVASAIVISTLVFASQGQALPSTSLMKAQAATSVEAMVEKAHYMHHHYHHHYRHHHHHGR